MEIWERNLAIARIISGILMFDSRTFIMKFGREARYMGEVLYSEALRSSFLEGLYSEDSLLNWMKENEFWSDVDQNILDGIATDIESLKVGLFQALGEDKRQKSIRKTLNLARSKYEDILAKRNKFNHLTIEYVASSARLRYLIKSSLVDQNFEKKQTSSSKINKICTFYLENKFSENQIRELARSDPWLSIYSVCPTENKDIFGCPPADYSDEQRGLLYWSLVYDNIRKHEECPCDEVINDDDMFDGFLIIQRRNAGSKKNSLKDMIDSNEKLRDAGEIFVPIQTLIDQRELKDTLENKSSILKEVENLNDSVALSKKKQRLDYVQKHGFVEEKDMPDTKSKLQMLRNKISMQKG